MVQRIIGSGGGGCFRKGSQVQLEGGKTIAIESLKEGDTILSFNDKEEIELAKVTKVHIHKEPQPIIRVNFWKGYIDITPNHWVLNQYGSFVEISTLSENDALVDGMGHLRPILGAEILEPETVYNLTVEPNHTFICNNIRVHNGGHREKYPVIGSGGGGDSKGGGGSRAAVEAPDSLQSRAYAKVLDLLCEGEIEGLVNGANSIYLNDTPIQNINGTYNFNGVTWYHRTGTQDQTYIPGFDSIESATNVGIQIKGYTPAEDPEPAKDPVPVTRRYTNENIDGVRLTISIPALQEQNLENGDVNGTTVQLEVFTQYNNGGFVPASVNAIWTETPGTFITQTSTTAISPFLPFNWSILHNASNTTLIETIGAQAVTQAPQLKCGFNFEHYVTGTEINPATGEQVKTYSPIVYKISQSSNGGASWEDIETKTVYPITSTDSKLNISSGGILSSTFSVLNVLLPKIFDSIITYTNEVYTSRYPIGTNVGIKITVLSGGTISNFATFKASYNNIVTISGKASSKYQRSIFVPFYQQGTWDIKVTRITNESTKQNLSNQTWLDLETEVIYGKLRYPNSALVGLQVDASQFGTIPSRAYDIKMLKVKIPSNYNPLTRVYTGTWDGTFSGPVWTNNPAWCFYDLVTSGRYGLGEYIDANQVDKWSLYTIGKYCDELVPDGVGGQEPRFTCNFYIQTRQDAYKILNDMVSIFRGMVYWSTGSITTIQDSPVDATYLYNQTNVIDGVFNYTGSSTKARHTVALVTWNDPLDMCRPKVEYVEDTEGISKYGIIESNIVAIGCTSVGQAHRVGKWLLLTERIETDIISFKTGLESTVVRPGQIIKVADPSRSGTRLGGRITSVVDTSTITIDSAPEISITNFNFYTFKTDGSIQESTVAANSAGTNIVLNTPLVEAPTLGSIYILSSLSIESQLYRVITIKENSPTEYEITALLHNPDKYLNIEKNIKLPTRAYSVSSIYPISPTNLLLSESLYLSKGNVLVKLSASWSPVPFANKYIVTYKRAEGNLSSEILTDTPHIDIADVVPDTYTVNVAAVNAVGLASKETATSTINVLGKTAPPANITGLTHSIIGTRVFLNWNDNIELDFSEYEVRLVDTGWGEPSNYLYKGAESSCYVNPPAPGTSFTYYIKAVDTTGNYSLAAASQIFNATVVPQVFNGTISVDLQNTSSSSSSVLIQWVEVTPQFGLKHYKFINGTNTPIYLNSTYIAIPADWVGSRNIYITTIDNNGYESATTIKSIDLVRPGTVPSPTYALSKVSGEVVMTLTWGIVTQGSLPIAGYEVRSSNTGWGDNLPIYRGMSNSVSIPNIIDNLGETWYIKAFDTQYNYSELTTNILLDDLVPPVNVTNFTNEIVLGKLVLKWTESTSLDVVSYEIRKTDLGWGINDTDRIYYGNNTQVSVNISTLGSYTFYIRARDVSGTYSISSIFTNFTYVSPTPVSAINYNFLDDQNTSASIILNWTNPSPQFGVKEYKVAYEGIERIISSNVITIPANWIDTRSYNIYVIDNNGIESIATTLNLTKYRPTQVGIPQVEVTGSNITLKWAANSFVPNSGYLPIAGYEIRDENLGWGSAGFLYRGNTQEATLVPSIDNTTTLYIKAYDTDNEYSELVRSVVFNRQAVPNITSASYTFFDTSNTSATITLNWTNAITPEFGLKHYKISFNGTINTTSSNTITLPANWLGERTFTVYTVDAWDKESSGITIAAVKSAPNSPINFYPQVIDNTVMLTWTQPTITSLPISHYRVKVGDPLVHTWSTAEDLGRKDGAFTTISESQQGTYRYWICSIDTDNVESTPINVTCEVAEPPDFVFHNHLFAQYGLVGGESYSSNVVYTNARYDTYEGGHSIVLPINTTETYTQHFTNNSWDQPQDQVTAGYPKFITPSLSSGSYQEKFDLGTVLAGSKIILACSTADSTVLAVVPTIEVSDDNITWDVYSGIWEVFVVNFRYIRITLSVTSSNPAEIIRLYNISCLLNAKLINDSNNKYCLSTDTVGTIVNFSKEFIDIASITVSPNGTTPLIPVYDYYDTVINGTYTVNAQICTVTAVGHTLIAGQNIKLYFSTGNAASGVYSITSVATNTFTLSMQIANTSGNTLGYSQSMRIYLFNNAGTRQSGSVSWTVKGY